ncbi:hypothetical protein BCV70DRAFT_165767 [Testicularia cyperi]|uniref:Trafficking protein particle complex subunit 11 domain-containing protein n=1 Tax=Testicularia cyperi TaxID=1882483 RepID=A0A317XJL6_9BASI|nr:hypothetical protein BCV70DRAFT_165767 [Testicularia cyperi]
MNSYPAELLNHHFACMVVAGLTPPTSSAPTPTPKQPPPAAPATSEVTATTDAATTTDHPTALYPDLCKSLHDILASRGKASTFWDPARGRAAVFHTAFADLNARLPPHKTRPSARHVASSLSGVDQTKTPAAAVPSDVSTAAFASLPPRSPLSPLHPNSPLFPDGIIAPIWVRKHRELVPAVFVAFYCLPAAAAATPAALLRHADEALIQAIADRRRSLAERGIKLTVVLLTDRERLDDPQLEARLSFIRRSSALDSRASLFVLTPVSRQELGEFVTSLHGALFEAAVDYYREHARRVKRKRSRYPPPASTTGAVASAIASLHSSGQRSSHNNNNNNDDSTTSAGSSSAETRTVPPPALTWLSREGWIVRSEYKLAVFAELQGDNTEALLRYREAYELLCISPTCLLGSTRLLPPRTKRWAEAKVLADTLCIKICKHLLYGDDGEAAARFFRRHLTRFTELSTGWGIGSTTFEYWSWLGKQYRVFAELVEQATRSVAGAVIAPFALPVHAPPLPSRLLHPDAKPPAVPQLVVDPRGAVVPPPGMLTPNQNATASSVSPATVLQGAAAYFYLSALCVCERRARAREQSALIESRSDSSSVHIPDTPPTTLTPLAREQKADYPSMIVEHLTLAYDSAKRARSLPRSSLMIAAHIATTYFEAAQYPMALRFLERITRSYARDDAVDIRKALVRITAECAVRTADVPAAVRAFVEAVDLGMLGHHEGEVARSLVRFLSQSQSQSQSGDGRTPQPAQAGNDSASNTATTQHGLLTVQPIFIIPTVECGDKVAFQVQIRNTSVFDLAFLKLGGISVVLRTAERVRQVDLVVAQSGDASTGRETSVPTSSASSSADDDGDHGNEKPAVQLIDVGTIAVDAREGDTDANAQQGSNGIPVPVSLGWDPDARCHWALASGRMIPLDSTTRKCAATTTFKARSYHVSISAAAVKTAYMDEKVGITLTIENGETDKRLFCVIDATLQPTYEGRNDRLSRATRASVSDGGREEPLQSLRDWEIGVLEPQSKKSVTLELTARDKKGTRTVDFSLRASPADDSQAGGQGESVMGSVSLSIEAAFEATFTIESDQLPAVGDQVIGRPSLFEPDAEPAPRHNNAGKAQPALGLGLGLGLVLHSDLAMVGSRPIRITAINLVGSTGEQLATITDAESEEEDAADYLGQWELGDRFSLRHGSAAPVKHVEIVWMASDSTLSPALSSGSVSAAVEAEGNPETAAAVPSGLMAKLTYPTRVTLMAPFDLHVTLSHSFESAQEAVVSLDSSDHFTVAGTRKLSLPFLVAGCSRRVHLARLVPMHIGSQMLPNLTIRWTDASGIVNTASTTQPQPDSPVFFQGPDAAAIPRVLVVPPI